MGRRHKTSAPTETSDADPEQLPVVYPFCFTRNSVRQNFCRRCGTPLTGLAVTDPLGQVYSEGDAYRKAIDNPDRPIVQIGMWLIVGPIFLGCVVLIVWFIALGFTTPFGPVTREGIFAVAVLPLSIVSLGSVTGIMLVRTTRNFLRLRRKK